MIGDRHDLSSLAYQGGGRGIDEQLIRQIKQAVLGDFSPDLTLYLDIDPAIGLARARARGELDRIELEQQAFFERTRMRYLALARHDPRIHVIDASQNEAQVAQAIRRVLESALCIPG